MNGKILYSVTGQFDTPDDIIHAAEEVKKAGYKRFDVHTSYPVHGMPSAMGLRFSMLGYVTLVLGLTGALGAFFFMWWASGIDYPNVVGGKPYFPQPGFVPITFEVTVLLASVGTVIAMLFVFFKLPNNSHPLHDTPYMKFVSEAGFGISIESRDKKFNEDEVRGLLINLGAHDITPVYYDEEEISYKPKVFSGKFVAFLAVTFVVISAASYFTLNKLLYEHPFNWMTIQDKLNAQDPPKFFSNGFSMQRPVEGTVARGHMPYMFAGQPDLAGSYLVNPLAPTTENLQLGRRKFNTYCSPCHGFQAKGDARLNGQFPNPPTLHSDKARTWPDGRIYAVIMEGQNIMPSYAKQTIENERWAIILYIRALQRSLNANVGDVQ